MDLNTLKGLSTVFVMIAFIGICWWAFAPSRKKQFRDAANLPFADDVEANQSKLHREDDEDKKAG
ncbi:cbb3-type cytochrome c oxidase subunit 3 [Pseudomaricurvus alkylphenolicus]|jgi:cytochrome c oxidase cbb3-type subunit 4|uniref:cbb3-type cytochrome oxidase subunit 3 n=1 Tax=Pseudomaricurvus alkylphenolicus TaxID=1306991 RepID=UPI001420F595|nr:cbb3-type cytochrome c oxidase subunit 3 [Pseudomaricurvus alkylphenolicus]NIB41947.1 cbb3-type cytochrome c oxidase subunit 3 [Pseudomaricurvus alkylphenolicus]